MAQRVPSHHNLATLTYLSSAVENAQEPTKTFMSLQLSFTVNPSLQFFSIESRFSVYEKRLCSKLATNPRS